MKGINTFLQALRDLHKGGKLDDVTSRQLNTVVARLRHCIHIGDRRKAERHFDQLCDMLRDVLVDSDS